MTKYMCQFKKKIAVNSNTKCFCFLKWYGSAILRLLFVYCRIERMSQYIEDNESQFLTVEESSYEYGKGED